MTNGIFTETDVTGDNGSGTTPGNSCAALNDFH